MIAFREATIGDEELVLEYIKKLARFEQMEDEVSGTTEDVVNNIFNNNTATVLIAMDEENNNVGFSLYFYNFSTFQVKPGLYIEDVYIDEDYRSLGYGTEFFNHYINMAKEKNCGRVEWICLDWNTDAIAFYEQKLGATPMDGWTIRRITL